MGFPEVGLQAVLEGTAEYEKNAKSVSSATVDLGNSVLKTAGIAAGIGVAAVGALGAGLVGLAGSALEPIGDFEKMSASLASLAAREIQESSGIEKVITVSEKRVELTKKEQAELDKLTKGIDAEVFKRDQLAQKIAIEESALGKLEGADKRNEEAISRKKLSLEAMKFQFQQTSQTVAEHQAKITSLTAAEGQMVPVTKTIREGQMDFNEALAQAGPKAKELIEWVEQLAIISPFTSEDVAAAMQTAMSFGLTTEKAKELVSAEINFAAATGKSGEAMQRVSFALGKMNTSGKVSGEVLMQLAEAGVPAAKILAEMGYTADDASKGLVPADKFMQAVIADFNKFGDAAKAQANTWPGLLSSLEDLKKIALREFFTKTFEAIKPYVVEFVTMLQDPGVRKWLSQVGELLGTTIANGLASVVGWVKEAKTWLDGFIPMVKDLFSGEFTLGDIEWHDYFPSWLADTVEWLIANLPLIQGALEGIGAVLAGAAIAAAIAGIGGAVLALANPITALIAAGALLGAAWETNWMGMRDIITEFWENQAKPALEDLVDWLKVNVPKAIEALVKFWEKDLLPALIKFSEWVKTDGIPSAKEFAKWVTTKLIPVLKDLIKWIESKLVPVLVDLAKSLGKAQLALSDTSKEMTKTGGTFDKLANFWAKNGDKIKKTTEDVFNYVVSQIQSKLQVAQDTVAIVSDVMAGDWGDAWKRMQSLLDNALNTITLGITGKMKEIGQTIGKALAGILSDWQGSWNRMLSAVGDALNRISQTIGNALNDFAKRISDAASSLYNAAVTMMGGLISGVVSQASAFTSRVISIVQGAVNSLLTSITSGGIYSTLSSAGRSIITVIQSAIASVTSLGQALINAVASAVSGLVNSVVSGGIGSTLRSVGQTIVNLISAAVSTVTSLASSLIGVVASAISGVVNAITSGALYNTLRAAGGAIIDGLVQGIQDNADAVADTLSDIVNAAIQAIKDQLGITGDPQPSTYMAAVGAALMEGYAQGILSQGKNVTNSMQAAMLGAMGGAGGLTLAPALVSGPGLGVGGGGNTTINNFHVGGNNITNGMDAAVFEARVLSVIRKNLR